MIQSRKSWNQTMSPMTGLPACCSPISHGEGWPRPAKATPPAPRTATLVTTKAINRLSTRIVLCAPSTRKTAADGPFRRPPQASYPAQPRWARRLPLAWQFGRSCGGPGEIPVSQTTIPGLPQCTLLLAACDKRLNPQRQNAPYLSHRANGIPSRHYGLHHGHCLTGQAEHVPTEATKMQRRAAIRVKRASEEERSGRDPRV